MHKTKLITLSLVIAVILSTFSSIQALSDSHENAKDMKGEMKVKMKKCDEMKDKMMMPPTSNTSAAALRTTLNLLVAEHVWLAAAATNAALNGNQAEFKAAAAALDENSIALAAANGSVYGEEAAEAFLPLWRKHIGFFVEYTNAVAAKDTAKKEEAMNNLVGYSEDFGAFIHSASPSLPADAVAGLVREHALTFKAVIDAQASGNDAEAYTNLRQAVAHMRNIADAHSEAIVLQFPDKFSG